MSKFQILKGGNLLKRIKEGDKIEWLVSDSPHRWRGVQLEPSPTSRENVVFWYDEMFISKEKTTLAEGVEEEIFEEAYEIG